MPEARLKARINDDVKSAMLAGDRETADVLRGLKSAILNEEIAAGAREHGLSDAAIEAVIVREVKKRDEAATLYEKGGNQQAAGKELAEKGLLQAYLPQQLTDEELQQSVQAAIAEAGASPQAGKIIGAVKQQVGTRAEGARVAAAVQEALR